LILIHILVEYVQTERILIHIYVKMDSQNKMILWAVCRSPIYVFFDNALGVWLLVKKLYFYICDFDFDRDLQPYPMIEIIELHVYAMHPRRNLWHAIQYVKVVSGSGENNLSSNAVCQSDLYA
jgi:predicted membrane protein